MSHTSIAIPDSQSSSQTNPPQTQQDMTNNERGDDGDQPALPSGIKQWLYVVVCYVVAFPFIIVCWFFCPSSSPLSLWNTYQKLSGKVPKITKLWVASLPHVAIRRRFTILCLAWVVVNLSVRELRSMLLLGSELWKFSILVAQVLCGYHISSQGTKILVYVLCKNNEFTKKTYAKFYAKGARRSVSLVLYSGSLMLTWVLYFRRSWGIKKTPETEVILHVGTRFFVTLAVGSLLWLFKRVLVLLWQANAVYSRFKQRILDARLDIYLLAQICVPDLDIWTKIKVGQEQKEEMDKRQKNEVAHCADEAVQDTNNLNNKKEREDSAPKKEGKRKNFAKVKAMFVNFSNAFRKDDGTYEEHKAKAKTKAKAMRLLFGDKANMYDIKRMAMFFINFSKVSGKDDGTLTYDVSKKCQEIKPSDPDNLTEDDFKKFTDLKDGERKGLHDDDKHKKLFQWFKEEHRTEGKISYAKFEKSMVKAHKNCMEIGRTLFDAREVVKVLNRVWTCIVVVIATIAWILLTDIVSTKMLLLIVSPFLAATFVFGDTCKRIFEGIIFSFVNHPFDVGDLCIIEETELEVKRMSIFSTTFKVFGTTEEVLYPNSELASKPITHLKGDPPKPDPIVTTTDPYDYVELPLDSNYTKSMLEELQGKINRFFEDDKGMKYQKGSSVVIKEIGNNCIKMEVRFQHAKSINDTTHSQCLETERRQRSELLLHIKQFTEEINNNKKIAASN